MSPRRKKATTPPRATTPRATTSSSTPAPAPTSPPTSPEALAVWLGGRRWFASAADPAVGAAGPAVELTRVELPLDPPLAIGLADTDDGRRYQLLVPGGAGADLADVADEPAAADALARWVAAGTTSAASPAGTVTGHWLDGRARLGATPARPLGGEQSNTSVIVGGTHVLKVFRRLQPGRHPEIEVGAHLAAVARTSVDAPVAHLAGWYDLQDASGAPSTALGVVQELVPGALDAWGLVLSALAGDAGGLLARLHELGGALAALHVALAVPAAGTHPDPESPEAFGAVPLAPARLDEVVAELTADASRALATSLDQPAALTPLVGRSGEVAALAASLVARLGTDLGAAIRHHGDLHLGQVVDGADGWIVLDFEGEPTRPLADRRRRHSPLRDVAGMLRSFAYAAATHRRSDGNRLSDGWEPAARAAFLDGYLAAVDPALLPVSAAATRTLLHLLELEKVVYEIHYELAHRPDWVGLPVEGLHRLLAEGPA